MNSELKKPELLKLAENTGMVNVIFSHLLKFVFLGIPRTANRAAHRALMELPGATQHEYLIQRGIPKDCSDYFTFCCVRNPYQRFLSWYRWRAQPHAWQSDVTDMSFAQYVRANERRQLGPVTIREFTNNNRLDHVYHFEGLPKSLLSIQSIDGIESINFKKCGTCLGSAVIGICWLS